MAKRKGSSRILVIEDDPGLTETFQMVLGDEGYDVDCAGDGAEGLKMALENDYDLVLTDFRLPSMGGLDIVEKLHSERPRMPVILMTNHGTTDLAIGATKRGAFDYLLKPIDIDLLLEITENACRASRLMGKPVEMGEDVPGQSAIIGTSPAMQEVYKQIGKVASTRASVLLAGETGTGKELVAKAIYQHSDRADQPFIAVNCGAIPENLLESELFGHHKGAFTGADVRRIGRFEQATGGTLFLDEIGDMPVATQVKILRVLQERKIQPLGGSEEIEVDVRVIAATHQDLEALMGDGLFREDLFYRLNNFEIRVPPLRERLVDTRSLVSYFARRCAEVNGFDAPTFAEEALAFLETQKWPGNVRQLENVVNRVLLQNRGFTISARDVENAAKDGQLAAGATNGGGGMPGLDQMVNTLLLEAKEAGGGSAHALLIADVEKRLLRAAIELSHGHQSNAASWLGLSRVTLRSKLSKYGISSSVE